MERLKRRDFLIGGLGLAAAGMAGRDAAAQRKASAGGWVSRTGNLGAGRPARSSVTILAAVPEKDEIIAGLDHAGLWSSTTGGITWSELSPQRPIANLPAQIVFDRKHPGVFWEAGIYGPGVYRTSDGGKTFEILQQNPCDGVGVDMTDPDRRTLITAFHEMGNTLTVSVTGGRTWHKTPAAEGVVFDSNPCVVGDNTFVVGARGTRPGIYRSEDGGR